MTFICTVKVDIDIWATIIYSSSLVINVDGLTWHWIKFDSVRGKTLRSFICVVNSAGRAGSV